MYKIKNENFYYKLINTYIYKNKNLLKFIIKIT